MQGDMHAGDCSCRTPIPATLPVLVGRIELGRQSELLCWVLKLQIFRTLARDTRGGWFREPGEAGSVDGLALIEPRLHEY